MHCCISKNGWFMCVKNQTINGEIAWGCECEYNAHATHVDCPYAYHRCTWLNNRFIMLLWLYKVHSITVGKKKEVAFDKHRSYNEFSLNSNWFEFCFLLACQFMAYRILNSLNLCAMERKKMKKKETKEKPKIYIKKNYVSPKILCIIIRDILGGRLQYRSIYQIEW